MTAPRTPRQARANRLTGRILLAVIAALALLTAYLVMFVFPKRRAHRPSQLREQLKPALVRELSPVEPEPAPATSAPSTPAPGSAP